MVNIKVINNKYCSDTKNTDYEEQKAVTTFCEHCDSELEICEEDTYIGWLGARFVKCPCCGEETMVDEMEGIEINRSNVEFPTHFLKTNKNVKHVSEVSDKDINKQIKRGIDDLRNNKDGDYWYTSFGNLFLVIFKYNDDNEYEIYITRDFYNGTVKFQIEDEDCED